MHVKSVERVSIVGDGYFPYLAALYISQYSPADAVTIIDAGATNPQGLIQSLGCLREFHRLINISEKDFVKKTRAQINLGFHFDGFSAPQWNHFFSEPPYGFDMQGYRFDRLFTKIRETGVLCDFSDFSIVAQLAKANRFTPPSPNPKSVFAGVDYGYCVSETVYKSFLREIALRKGISVEDVTLKNIERADDGFIQSVNLDNGNSIEADLYIDMSSNRALMPDKRSKFFKALYPNLPDLFLQDSCSADKQLKPYSTIHKVSSTLVQSGYYDGQLYQKCFSENSGRQNHEVFEYNSRPWTNNVVAMGNAFTNRKSILIDNVRVFQECLIELVKFWPRTSDWRHEQLAYNRTAQQRICALAEIDTLIFALHFNRLETLSDSAVYKHNYFCKTGKAVGYEKEALKDDQWMCLALCLGIIPQRSDFSVSDCDEDWIKGELNKMRSILAKAANAAPNYHQFIQSAHR